MPEPEQETSAVPDEDVPLLEDEEELDEEELDEEKLPLLTAVALAVAMPLPQTEDDAEVWVTPPLVDDELLERAKLP
jgi:hypothetical protein